MGFKRPFDDEEFQDLPCKHLRQLDVSNRLTEFQEFVPISNDLLKPDISGEDGGGFHQHQCQGASEDDTIVNEFANNVEKDFENSAALSWVTSSSSEEDVGSRPTPYASLSLEHFEFDFPRGKFAPLEDSYSSLLDWSPRKQVPLGPNYQASLPSWGRHMNKNISNCKATMNDKNSSNYPGSDNIVDNENEEKLMGTCIIPMPDSYSPVHNSDEVGKGFTDCECLDEGSFRCVQQHIMEAREELLKSLGHEKFVKLGFCDMGEVVSCKWSEEEEQIFHDAVYSNPVSVGRNFWKHLAVAFPSRTKKEIVSYYFNVFMLRRRASQNRSYSLDIDSDDDEWHGNHRDGNEVLEEDEDSAIESPVHEKEQADCEEDCLSEDDDEDEDDSDGDVGNGSGDTSEKYFGIDYVSQDCLAKSFDENGLDSVVPDVDTITRGAGDGFNVQDDSCTSFEFQPDMANSCRPVDAEHSLQVTGVKTDLSKCLHGKIEECNDLVDYINLLDPCDAKVWDVRYPSPLKGVDLLPTCNIIEEIFGQGTVAYQDKK